MTSTLTKSPEQKHDNNSVSNVTKEIKSRGGAIKVLGILTLLLGIGAIVAPTLTGLSIYMTVGILVIAGGIMKMAWAFGEDSFGRGLLAFAIGVLTVISGLVLTANPAFMAGMMTVLLAAYLFADGVIEILAAFRLQSESGRGWLLLGGIASIALSFMMWRQFPLSGAWAIGILLGMKLLFVGIAMIKGGSRVRTLADKIEHII